MMEYQQAFVILARPNDFGNAYEGAESSFHPNTCLAAFWRHLL
jgi:hypothetical protein